jgi:wee1-like protein kinase
MSGAAFGQARGVALACSPVHRRRSHCRDGLAEVGEDESDRADDYYEQNTAVLRRMSLHDSPAKHLTPPRVTKRPKIGSKGLTRMGSAPVLVKGGKSVVSDADDAVCASPSPATLKRRNTLTAEEFVSSRLAAASAADSPLALRSGAEMMEFEAPLSPGSICSESSMASGVGAMASLALNGPGSEGGRASSVSGSGSGNALAELRGCGSALDFNNDNRGARAGALATSPGLGGFRSRRRNTVLGVNCSPSHSSYLRGATLGCNENSDNTPVRRRKLSAPNVAGLGRRASVGVRPTPPKANINPFTPQTLPRCVTTGRSSPTGKESSNLSPETPRMGSRCVGNGSFEEEGGTCTPGGTPGGPETPRMPLSGGFSFSENLPPPSDVRESRMKAPQGFFIRRASTAMGHTGGMAQPGADNSLSNPSDSDQEMLEEDDVSESQDCPQMSRFLEDFEMLSTVGTGSFGTVLKVQRRLDGCLYAVKRSQRQSRGELERQSMLNEVFALAALCTEERTPHILQYHNAWIEDDRLYIQTELCDTTLEKALIARAGRGEVRPAPLPVSEAHSFLRQMLLALEIVHRRGMVHLDIKPGNIFLKGGVYKLGDFGLVTLRENSGNIMEGDARYMSKELLEDNCPHLTKADIFSLGITLYEALTARPLPVNGAEWHRLRSGCDTDFLSEIKSPSLVSILTATLHPDPEWRPEAAALLRLPALQSQVERRLGFEQAENARLRQEIRKLSNENKQLRAQIWGGVKPSRPRGASF